MASTVIIGIGNEYRSDDAVGIVLLRSLGGLAEKADLKEASGEGTALIDLWQGYSTAILVDAVSSGSVPGTIYRFDSGENKIPSLFFSHSTHAFSVAEAVEIARALSKLPERLIVYGIEGKSFAPGTEISTEVQEAMQDVIHRILTEI